MHRVIQKIQDQRDWLLLFSNTGLKRQAIIQKIVLTQQCLLPSAFVIDYSLLLLSAATHTQTISQISLLVNCVECSESIYVPQTLHSLHWQQQSWKLSLCSQCHYSDSNHDSNNCYIPHTYHSQAIYCLLSNENHNSHQIHFSDHSHSSHYIHHSYQSQQPLHPPQLSQITHSTEQQQPQQLLHSLQL